jgi:signal peptidase I
MGAGVTVRRPKADSPTPKKRARSWRRRLAEDAGLITIAILVAIVARAFVAQAYYIPSTSMVPQLQVNDRVVVSRLAYHLHPVHRGDIVVFKAPPQLATSSNTSSNPVVRLFRDAGVALGMTQDQTVLIKRVIALPGERVWAAGGRVYVNGDLLLEPYLPRGTITDAFGPVRVPAGDVWVMGDNRPDSEDSRYFGPVPEHTIIGRAIWRVWPPWRAAFL